jgi:hypothetical protein
MVFWSSAYGSCEYERTGPVLSSIISCCITCPQLFISTSILLSTRHRLDLRSFHPIMADSAISTIFRTLRHSPSNLNILRLLPSDPIKNPLRSLASESSMAKKVPWTARLSHQRSRRTRTLSLPSPTRRSIYFRRKKPPSRKGPWENRLGSRRQRRLKLHYPGQ